MKQMIDVTFDFTTDSPGYWDGFWEKNDLLGGAGSDPDEKSPTLKRYHRLLWSRRLPCGEVMELQEGKSSYYLKWKDFYFGSDSIIVEFRYYNYIHMIEQVKQRLSDYRAFYEDQIRKSYTIGGMIIFPQHRNSMNQMRGMNRKISDRWDLTLECIRRYYSGEESPLSKVIESDKAFYDLFVDFKGYVDFFFLQDSVSADYSSVDIWCGEGDFSGSGLPATVDEYFLFIEREMEFLKRRNARIEEFSRLLCEKLT